MRIRTRKGPSLTRSNSLFKPAPLGLLLTYLVLGFWTLVVLFPIYWLVVTSLKLPIQVNSGPFYLPWIDFQPSIDAWQYILIGDLQNDTFRPYLNTIVVALSSSV